MATQIQPGQPGYVPSNVGNPTGGGNYGPTAANPYGWSTVNGTVVANSAPAAPTTSITTPPTSGSSGVEDPTLSGMMSQIEGLSSTITSDKSSNTDLYNQIIAGQNAQKSETDAALQEQEGAAVNEQTQANQAQTEGTAQTAATLSQYHGVNTALTQFWTDLSNKQQQAVESIKSQYDAAIANADASAATNIQNALLDQIHTNQTQDQQMFDNAMSIFNGMTSVLNNQQQNSIASQQLDLSKQSLNFQQQQQDVTNSTNQMNTVLSSLAGNIDNTWKNLSPDTQSQLTALAQKSGMDPATLQAVVNSNAKTAVSQVSVPGLLGTTILNQDKAGHTISSSYIPMVDPNSPQGQAIIGSQVSWSSPSTPGGSGYISSSVLSSMKLSGTAALASVMGAYPGSNVKILDTADSAKMSSYKSSIPVLGQIAQTVSSDMSLPVDAPSVITGSVYRTVQDKLNGDLSAIESENPGIVEALMSAAGGATSGFAIRAIIGTDSSALINVNSQQGTILSNLKGIANTIATNADSLVPQYGTQLMDQYPDLMNATSPGTSATTYTGSSSGTGNSGSTDPLGIFGQ